MKLVVSNIAWTNEEEPEIAKLLQDLGIKYIEVAPTKKWPDPTKASAKQVADYVKFWADHGIEIVAFQSMLFTRPDLKIFEPGPNRVQTLEYLKSFIGLAGKMGAKRMVFGSPKNRQRGKMNEAKASKIASDFFGQLGDEAQKHDVCFCIEPNAPQYNCDFVTTAAAGIEIVKKVNNPGFGLHLDIACMTLAGDDIQKSIEDAASVLKHFHISSPMLEQVEDRPDVKHQVAADSLKKIGYGGFVSIEMKPGDAGQNYERVRKAIEFAKRIYAD